MRDSGRKTQCPKYFSTFLGSRLSNANIFKVSFFTMMFSFILQKDGQNTKTVCKVWKTKQSQNYIFYQNSYFCKLGKVKEIF